MRDVVLGFIAVAVTGCFIEPERPAEPVRPLEATVLTAGGKHACAIDRETSVRCWGSNDDGELGYHGPPAVHAKLGPAGTGWTAVAAGAHHTCGIRAAKVYCWGANAVHQASESADGRVDVTPIDLPVTATAVFAGGDATCAIDGDGQLYCWGRIDASALDVFDKPTQIMPAGIAGPWASVAISADHACARDASVGKTYCWGKGDHLQIAVAPPQDRGIAAAMLQPTASYDAIAAGPDASCGTSNGRLVCWGASDAGLIGDQVADSTGVVVDTSHTWTMVVMGRDHVCAAAADRVSCFGDDPHGALGDSFDSHRTMGTTAIVTDVAQLVAGDDFSCALDSSRAVQCWGSNSYGELGNDEVATQRSPTRVHLDPAAGETIQAVSAGDGHTCALVGDAVASHVWCWGDNRRRQVSVAASATEFFVEPIGALDPVIAISSGGSHTCAIGPPDTIRCWGADTDAQLGIGSQPTGISTVGTQLGAAQWTQVAAGEFETCAIDNNRKGWCWGRTPAMTISQPQQLAVDMWSEIAVGNNFALAIRLDTRHAAGWGTNCVVSGGGLQAPIDYVTFGGENRWQVAVASGLGGHACVLANAAITCFGANGNHQVATANNPCANTTMVPPPAGESWVDAAGAPAIAVSGEHSCAVATSGRVYCWGANQAGELGQMIGATADAPALAVGGPVAAITTGRFHTCAISMDASEVQCWGKNQFGELGDGHRFHFDPVQVLQGP